MTGLELVLAALAAGASAGVADTASSAIRDAYEGLHESVRLRLARRGEEALGVLTASEAEPGVWEAGLGEELAAAGVDRDEEIITAARALLDLLVTEEQASDRWSVDARGAKGVQNGDRNHQVNNFN